MTVAGERGQREAVGDGRHNSQRLRPVELERIVPGLNPDNIGDLEDRLETDALLTDTASSSVFAAPPNRTDGLDVPPRKPHLVALDKEEPSTALILDSQRWRVIRIVGVVISVLHQFVQKVSGFCVELLRYSAPACEIEAAIAPDKMNEGRSLQHESGLEILDVAVRRCRSPLLSDLIEVRICSLL